nr:reverse transcriptase domain-containing protein [Tanacetum cinerariifolium]
MDTNKNGDDVPPAVGGDLPVPDLRTMEELCQLTLNGWGGAFAPIAVQATNFGLKNDMIQQVQNFCQFHGLSGDDANKHLDKFLHVTQSIKVNRVTDDALHLYLFPHSLIHHATAWFDRGTFMKRRPDECYDVIENMTAHHNDWDTSIQRSESSSSITSSFDPEIVALKAEMAEINKNLMKVLQINQQVKAVTHSCETCGGTHSYNDCPAIIGQTQNVYAAGAYNQGVNTTSSSGSGTLPSNTITNPKEDLKGITTRSEIAYNGPTIPTTSSSTKVVERETEVTKDTVPPTNNGSTKDVQPPIVQVETVILNSEPVVKPAEAPVYAPKPNPKPSIPYLSRLRDQKLRDKANDQKEKFFQIFQDLNFNISFADALILMPKFGLTIKSLLTNKEKLFELARTPLNEYCSAISLPELSPTCMTLELADRSISHPIGVAEDVFVKVGKFHFPVDFVVIDFDSNPRVPLILGRSFLNTGRALIDVYEGELTLRVGNKAITFNLDQTSRYSSNYDDMSVNRIDVIDVACEEYSQEVLGFFVSGNPTPYTKPIVSISSPTLTPFRDSDFLPEETNAFLAIDDEPISLEIDYSYYDLEGDILLLLEEFLNDDPSSPPLPPQELKVVEPKNKKSSIDEPLVVELKDLPPHLEYAFLEGDDKLLVIIAKDLKDEEKTTLIKVLKLHKQALAWQLFDIKGINPEFYTHKILIKDDFKPAIQHQRRVNPKSMRNTKDMNLVYGGNIKRELGVSCYIDAGYLTNVDDLKSQTGYVFILNGGVVDWKSAKQSIFATSSAKAEYIAAFGASKEVVWVRKFICGLGVVPINKEPILSKPTERIEWSWGDMSIFLLDIMADVNVNATADQVPTMAPPTHTDDQVLPHVRWCQLDGKWFDITKDTLIDAIQITPVNNNNAFSSPLTHDALINFVNDLDTMANVNVNAHADQAPTMAPPTRTNDQILPHIRWVPIGKSNCYLDIERSQSNPIYKIAVDILKHTNFFRAFTASSTIPSIYIQQDALQITPVNNNNAFSSPPTPNALINFVNDLGYPKVFRNLSDVVTNDMFQPWRALTTIINLCLTGKTSGFERPRAPVLQILWGVVNRSHIDYAKKKKATLIVIPSVRFTKLIIYYLQSKHKFHPRLDYPLYLPNAEPVLGYLKFSAKGTKQEVFGMPISNKLSTIDIQGEQYYKEYLEKVAKHQRYLASEKGSDPDSPALKPDKAIKKSKPSAPKADLRPPVTNMLHLNNLNLNLHLSSLRKRNPTRSLRSVDVSVDEGIPEKEPRVDDEEADIQRAVEESLKSFHDAPRGPLPPVVIREPDFGKFQPLPEVQGKGKEKRCTPALTEPSGHAESSSIYAALGLTDSASKSDEEVPHVVEVKAQDEGQAGPNPEPQPQLSPVVHDGPNPEHMDLEATDVSTQLHPEQMDEGFTATAYPNVQENLKLTVEEQVILEEPATSTGTLSSLQHLAKDFSFGDLFFNDKPSETENEKTTAETKVESMVSVTIQQNTSAIPPMTTPIIDLTSRPDSPHGHLPLQATTTETTTTTLTTTHPPPIQPQQSTIYSMLMKRIDELEQIMANLIQDNKHLEERLDSHGARLYTLENLDIPQEVSKAVDEIVNDAVDWAIQAPLRNCFRDLPEADIKEILYQRMWETNSYKAHKDHMMLYEALKKSMNCDYTDELLKDLAEARKKGKRDVIHQKRHLGLHLISHFLLHHKQVHLELQDLLELLDHHKCRHHL